MSVENVKNCVGCRVCESVCPVDAIKMEQDERGFLYPQIDKNKCIDCNICNKYCECFDIKVEKQAPTDMYAIKNKDDNIRAKSTSGGVYYELAQYVIEKQGVVYGCKFNDDMQAIHARAVTLDQAEEFMGSKYMQSDMSNILKLICEDLKDDRWVLFTGTPCQCVAIKRMCIERKISRNRLIVCDFLCHGVPSQQSFDYFIKYIEKRYKGKVVSYKFRDKEKLKNPPHPKGIRFIIKKSGGLKDIYSDDINDLWYNVFLKNYLLRESCFECDYIGFDRVSDFTIADFWGCEKHYMNVFDTKGISLMFVNTDLAQDVFKDIKSKFEYVSVERPYIMQGPLETAPDKKSDHMQFWAVCAKDGMVKAYSQKAKAYRKDRYINKIGNVLRKLLPNGIVERIRKIVRWVL